MDCEEFLKNLKHAAVVFGLIAAVDTIAINTAKENNIAVLLDYARLTAAVIVASSVKKLIMKEEEEDEDEEEDENALEEEDSKNK